MTAPAPHLNPDHACLIVHGSDQPGIVAAVSAMLDRLPFDLLYARFDVVRFEGRLAVLELELIEPMLYLGLAPGSAERLAHATIARLDSA